MIYLNTKQVTGTNKQAITGTIGSLLTPDPHLSHVDLNTMTSGFLSSLFVH